MQVLQPLIYPTLSELSHGLAPGRRVCDAVLAAQQHVQDVYRIVVAAFAIPIFGALLVVLIDIALVVRLGVDLGQQG